MTFSLDNMKKLLPLLEHDPDGPYLVVFDMSSPQAVVMDAKLWHATLLLKRAVPSIIVTHTSCQVDGRFSLVKEGHFSCSRKMERGGRNYEISIVRGLEGWEITGNHIPEFGEPDDLPENLKVITLWKRPDSSNFALPPELGWESAKAAGMFLGLPEIEYVYRQNKTNTTS